MYTVYMDDHRRKPWPRSDPVNPSPGRAAPAFQLTTICHRFHRPRPDPVTIRPGYKPPPKNPALFPLAFLVSICYYVFMIDSQVFLLCFLFHLLFYFRFDGMLPRQQRRSSVHFLGKKPLHGVQLDTIQPEDGNGKKPRFSTFVFTL